MDEPEVPPAAEPAPEPPVKVRKRPNGSNTGIPGVYLKPANFKGMYRNTPNYREKVAQTVALRVKGKTYKQIAKELNVSPSAVIQRLHRARELGYLPKEDEIAQILQNEVIPGALETVRHHIRRYDKKTAIETLKGVGIYQTNHKVQQDVRQQTVLRIEYVLGDGQTIDITSAADPPGVIGQPIAALPPASE